jgi:hypothetical protein
MSRAVIALAALALMATGCGVTERAAACDKIAQAVLVPGPKKRRTARTEELQKVAHTLQDAATRLTKVGPLPADLTPIADATQKALVTFAHELDSAAKARKRERAPEYAAARTKTEEARRQLVDLGRRFEQACSK